VRLLLHVQNAMEPARACVRLDAAIVLFALIFVSGAWETDVSPLAAY
jgi:hypothetical protein